METWILFAILASLSWAVVDTVDKYVLTKWVKKPIVPVMIVGIIGLFFSIFVYLIHGFSFLSYINIILALITGFFYVLAILFYFKAVKIEEISRVVPLFYLAPLFVLILAAIFLGEIFTPAKYIGIFLLVIGAILISLKKKEIRIGVGKAFWLMIFSSLMLAFNYILTKYLLGFTDFWTIFSYARIGSFIFLIPIFFLSFKHINSIIKEHGNKPIWVMGLNETLNVIGVLFITIAASVGFITLVEALSSIQPFFVLVFVVLLSVFYPKILKEEIGKSTMLQKFIAIVLMFIGAVLII